MGVLHQSRGKGYAASRVLEGMTTASRVAKQAEESAEFESMHDVAQRPLFGGLAGELGVTSAGVPIQAKMRLGEANDRYEREADRLAPLIVQQINAPEFEEERQDFQTGIQDDAPSKQLQTLRPTLQLKGEGTGVTVSPAIESAIANARGGGQPLESKLQERFGQAMRADFSGVRVHTDRQADALNQSVGARAFTTGQDLFFKRGEYKPGSRGGQELIAHELTHVVQKSQEHAAPDISRIVDRSGNVVNKEIGPSALKKKIKEFKKKLPKGGPHQRILKYLEGEVKKRFSKTGVEQFYKGAHIVFNDQGTVYNRVLELGESIAVRDDQGNLRSKKDFVGINVLNEFSSGEDARRMRAGAMFARRPNTGETSHYEHDIKEVNEYDPRFSEIADDDERVYYSGARELIRHYRHDFGWHDEGIPPQLGIDFPLEAGGHILVGIVPPRAHAKEGDEGSVGNTFVQTEGAGFQSFWQGVPMHLLGGFRNWGWIPGTDRGTQTGLLGQTIYSEKTMTEIREVDQRR